MQGAKPPPQTLTMHFTGGTDYPPNVFLTAPAAISKTKQNYYMSDNINHRKVAYKAFTGVNFRRLEYPLVT